MENNFDIHQWQAKFLKENTDVTSVEELGDFDGTLGQLQSIISGLIQHYGKDTQIRVDAGHNNVEFVIHSVLGEPFGLDEKKSAIQESEGYVEVMGPDFDQAIELLQSAWKEWKNGRATEPEDIPEAKQDIVDYITSLLR
jgi:NOL1/NOP2/fmu family ribosome biogenesis protein